MRPSVPRSRQLPHYGTHHAKMMLLKFARGVRVVVLTANFIEQDVSGKSQGVWYQEFPLGCSRTCDFEVRRNDAPLFVSLWYHVGAKRVLRIVLVFLGGEKYSWTCMYNQQKAHFGRMIRENSSMITPSSSTE